MTRITSLILAASVALALAVTSTGCKGKSEPAPATTAAPPAAGSPQEAAKAIFSTRCAACHGTTGAGDGAAAAQLNPKPRAFGDKSWQASVTDEHIEKIIKEGGAAVGKSQLMPPNPDLVAKPEVVTALRVIVRDFGK